MANKVLGRISTVLAVNAKPLQSGLNLAKGELESFATTVKSRLSSAGTSAERALKGMYTDFQRLERAVKAANSQQLNLKVQNPRAILDVARATERIAKPVTDAQKQFSALSQTVQSALLPVLQSSQKQAENFFDAISRNAKVTDRDFANTEARINRVTEAFRRATEASQATRGLASGQELRFQNPEFLRSTGRAAQLQQQAAALSPEAISGRGIVSLIGQQRVAADEAERLRATIDRIAVTRRGDAQAAQQAYAQQLAGLERINNALEEQITLANRANAANQQAANERSAFDTRELDRRSGATARRRGNAFEDATAGVFGAAARQDERFIGPTIVSVDSLIGRIRELDAQYQQLPAAARAALEPQVAILNSIANAAISGGAGVGVLEDAYERTRVRIEEAADAAERARTSFVTIPGNPDGEFGPPRPFSDLTGNRDPRTRLIAQLGQETGDLRNRIRGVGETLAGDLGPTVDNLTTRFQNLARAGVGIAADRVQQLRRDIASLNAALDSRQATGQRFAESFGGAGRAGLSLGVDERSLRGIGGQIEFVQGRLSALSQAVRGPVISALDALRTRAQQLFEGGALDTDEGRREIQLLREELIRTLSVAGGGSQRALAQALRRAGDVGRGGFDRFGLAIQQAAFAVEDFFSVTGGLDQRIRAAGNNISQLGFIAGGTTGLIIGISTAIGAQLVVALIKWADAGRTSEDRTKSLNDALQRQKSIVDELAQAYQKVAEAVQDAGLSDRGTREAGVRRQVEEIQQRQRQAREARILGTDEGVASARASVARAERELSAATTAGQQVRAQLSLNAAREQQRQEERRALDQASRPAETFRQSAIDAIAQSIRASSEQTVRTASVVPGLPFAVTSGVAAVSAEEATRERLAALQNIGQSPQDAVAALDSYIQELLNRGESGDVLLPLQQLREQILVYTRQLESDKLAARISRGVLQIVDAMESAQADVEAAFDGIRGASAIEDEIAAFGESLAQLQKAQADAAQRGNLEQVQAFNEDINAIRSHIKALQDAAASIRVFGTELQRLSESVSRDVAALEQRAEEARRNDIEQGTDDSRRQREGADRDLRAAREAQRQFEDTRASAVERFEQDAIRNNDPRFRRIREIDAMLSAPMGGVGADGTRGGTAEERRAARDERRALQRDIDNSIDNDPEVRAARKRADDATRQAQRAASEDRGRELSLTDAQRARREADRQAADIQAFFERDIGLGRRGVLDVAGRNAALNRLAEDQLKQVAPTLAGFREERINAALQGPSRAALNVTDAQTMEGQRELNRLLRGDDSAKDVNLVELQKQSELLQSVIDAINEQAGADVVEIRG